MTLTAELHHSQSLPQLTKDGQLKHFLCVEGLSREHLMAIIEKANGYLLGDGQIKNSDELTGTTVMNLFLKIPPAPAPLLKSPKNAWGQMS